MKTLSLVMITKNEEAKLKRCLNSIKDLVDEIIIVDTGSTDKTKIIASEFNAKIFDYKWDNNFSNARNFAINKSTSDWNLILDADEFITNIDKHKLFQLMNYSDSFIGQIKITNLFEQDGEIKKSNSFISRLAPKGIYFNGSIHEQLDNTISRKIVPIEVEHDGYLNTNKFYRNISLIINELKENRNDSYLLYQAAKTYYNNKMYNEAELYFEEFYKNINIEKDAFINDGIILYLYTIIKTKNFEKGLKIINENFDILSKSCDFYFVCGLFFTELVASNTEKYLSYFNNIELCYINALQIGNSNEIVEGTGSYLAAYNLGIFYELIGNIDKAQYYYKISSNYNYKLAKDKLNLY